MNVTFLNALIALVPASMLFSGSLILFRRGKSFWSFLQLLGRGFLMIVPLNSASYSRVRSTSAISLDAVGFQAQRGSLPRSLQRRSWSYLVPCGLFTSCASQIDLLTLKGRSNMTVDSPSFIAEKLDTCVQKPNSWEHCLRRVYSGACETLEVVLSHRLHFGRRGPDATKLRADAQLGGA